MTSYEGASPFLFNLPRDILRLIINECDGESLAALIKASTFLFDFITSDASCRGRHEYLPFIDRILESNPTLETFVYLYTLSDWSAQEYIVTCGVPRMFGMKDSNVFSILRYVFEYKGVKIDRSDLTIDEYFNPERAMHEGFPSVRYTELLLETNAYEFTCAPRYIGKSPRYGDSWEMKRDLYNLFDAYSIGCHDCENDKCPSYSKVLERRVDWLCVPRNRERNKNDPTFMTYMYIGVCDDCYVRMLMYTSLPLRGWDDWDARDGIFF